MSRSTKHASAVDDRHRLADQYRAATFALLRAARVLRDVTGEMHRTRVKVAPAALTDLQEANCILALLAAPAPAKDTTKAAAR